MDANEVRNSLAFLFASPPGFPDAAAPPRSGASSPPPPQQQPSVSPSVAKLAPAAPREATPGPAMERRRVGQAIRTHGHLSNRSRDGRSGLARPAAAPSRKLRRLLAIDDSPNLRAFIVQALTAQFPNMIVTLAPDGREGLRLARQEKPNLILLDFVLPDLPGDEVCRQLMADPATAEIPVVLMSSSSVAIESTQER